MYIQLKKFLLSKYIGTLTISSYIVDLQSLMNYTSCASGSLKSYCTKTDILHIIQTIQWIIMVLYYISRVFWSIHGCRKPDEYALTGIILNFEE